MLAIPLITREQVLGVLNLFGVTGTNAFDDEALRLAQVYADQAAVFPLGEVSGSLVGDVDCTAVNGNLQTDPTFDVDYTLLVSSPAIDAGPPPTTFDGSPCLDLAGGPRLRVRVGWNGGCREAQTRCLGCSSLQVPRSLGRAR